MNTADIKKYVFEYADSNMYVIASEDKALIIDPNISEAALAYLRENNIQEITILLTHEHYDHTSGLIWLSGHFKCTVICHAETALSLSKGRNSRPVIIASNRMNKLSSDEVKELVRTLPQNYSYNADIAFDNVYSFNWQGHEIRIVPCPGHSKGSCCIELDDNVIATGDSLIFETPVITRFPGGSHELYNSITLPYIEKISDETLILPGHGRTFLMKEARK